jgi:hypothetical protein
MTAKQQFLGGFMRIRLCLILTAVLSLGIATAAFSQINIVKELAGFNTGDQFGWAVTGMGDQNSDGIPDYAIGAPSANNYAGVVYIYSGSDHSLLGIINGSTREVFGQTLSSSGTRLLIGGINSVYVHENAFFQFTIDGYEWGEYVGDNIVVGDYSDGAVVSGTTGHTLHSILDYGTSACDVGDVNGDGIADFVMSSHNAYGSSRGAINVYSGSDATIIHHIYSSTQSAQFGYDVASLGDGMFLVTARIDDGGGLNAGAVYVYSAVSGNLKFSVSGSVGEQWGWAVTSINDVDGDGVNDILLGAAPNAGKVVVLSGNNGTVLGTFNGQSSFDNLGYSVTNLGGNLFAFGAPGATDGFNLYAGKVFIANILGVGGSVDGPTPDAGTVGTTKIKGKGKGKGKKR